MNMTKDKFNNTCKLGWLINYDLLLTYICLHTLIKCKLCTEATWAITK